MPWIARLGQLRDARDIFVGLRQGYPWLEPGHHPKPPRSPLGISELLRCEVCGHPQVATGRKRACRRNDPHDFYRLSVEAQPATQYPGIATEAALPECIRQHSSKRCIRTLFSADER